MVAATSRAQANGKTPIHSFFNMYFSGLEAFGQAYDPFTKGFARAQLEFMGHLNRRAQAYLEIPNRLAQCRTPQDLVNEQVRFWRSAYEDYTASMGRVTEALSSLAMPHLALGDEAGDGRDYISFSEPEEQRGSRNRDRKAA